MEDKYNWDYYTRKEKAAYREFIKGNNVLLKKHNIVKNCDLEINFAIRIAEKFFNVRPVGRLLDVGCGGGFMTQCFSNLGFKATGFDITQEAIEGAKKNFPGIDFFIGDGTIPKKYFNKDSFDLIHIREFHPFKVINDFDFQINVIEDYLDILTDGGIIIITQANPGIMGYGNKWKKYECLDYKLTKKYLKTTFSVPTAGPFYFFLLKHLRIIPLHKITIRIASYLTSILQFFLHKSWVEFFLIYKNNFVS